jgi:transcriptional regulator with XRE-family HTH domain
MSEDQARKLDYWPSLIQAIRASRNWSQAMFAEGVDSSQETVSRWERGAVLPSRQKQQLIERLAEASNISSLGGISHIVRLSPYPMLLCDSNDHVIAASASSGFNEGQSVVSQTPGFQHAYFEAFGRQLQSSGFWNSSGQSRYYEFHSAEHGDFGAVLVTVSVHGSIYCVVQAIPGR